ncbi:hypothetical protein JB92DRAFT_1345170 [Gautieria morchelliformis]|nr:hypothetical protein JB92DRAFT_1345170 [Gautieria morchelliformis]
MQDHADLVVDKRSPYADFPLEIDSPPPSLSDDDAAIDPTLSTEPRVDAVAGSNAIRPPSSDSAISPPGLPPPPSFVPQLFYETVRNTRPPVSLTPSSTGATRGTNSYVDIRDVSTPPLTPMSAPRDPRGADAPQSPGSSPADVSPVAAHRPARQSAPRRSLQRQSFPTSFYPSRSASISEPPYPASGAYPQHPPAGPAFMGQYMSTQPPHPMPLQPFAYSQPFAHPGIPAPDPTAVGIPFGAAPPPGLGFGYQRPSSFDALSVESHDTRSAQTYALAPPSPFAPSVTGPHPAPAPTTPGSSQHIAHQPYTPVHFSPPPSAPHYPGYPARSYAHSSPGLYTYGPSPYQQAYYTPPPASPEDAAKAGAWWYVTPGTAAGQPYESSPYRGGYYQPSMHMAHPEYDPYPTLGPGSPPNAFQGSSGQTHPPQQRMTHIPPRDSALLPSSPVPPLPPPGPSIPGPDPGAGPGAATSLPQPARDITPPPTVLRKTDTPGSPAAPSPASRKSYHPNPPPNRSEWVMWVGNVPSDATFDELWRFFNQPAPMQPLPPGAPATMSSRHVQPPPHVAERVKEKEKTKAGVWGGVSSVFLIARSNCAFVNFETEQHLQCAVEHFNGKPVRPRDARCPRLVCRVRSGN